MLLLREWNLIFSLKASTRTITTNHLMYVVAQVLECTKCKAFLMVAIETEDGPGTAKISNSTQIPSVLSLIMLIILMSQCILCVAAISTLLAFTATMTMGVKIEGGGSRAALHKG